jgi:hypothetical protein
MKLLEKDGLFIVIPKTPQDLERLWGIEGQNVTLTEIGVTAGLRTQAAST